MQHEATHRGPHLSADVPGHESGTPVKRRVGFLVLAIIAGGLLSLLAPPDWDPGQGSVRLTYLGNSVIDMPVPVGPSDEITLDASIEAVDVSLVFPSGIPVDSQVVATVAVTDNGQPIRPDVSAITIVLTLPNGNEELIPILAWDEDEQVLRALRRPPVDSAFVLGLLGFVVVLWVSEAIPLFVTSLIIPVVLVFGGIATAADATSPFFNPIIVLFFAGFLMAEAMQRCGLDHYIAVSITARAGRSAVGLFMTVLGVTAVLSMFMSNTAAVALLIPIAIAVTAPLADTGFRRALILGIAYAGTIGGVGSAIGTPANQLAIEFLDGFGGRTISFVEWFAFGLPMVIIFVPIMAVYLWKRSNVSIDAERLAEAASIAEKERHALGKPTHDQIVVLVIFGAVVAGWMTQTVHGIHAGIVALAGAVVLFILGKLIPEDLGRISWEALLTFGGGLTLGLYLVRTGTSDYLATRLTALVDVPDIVAVFAVAMITLLLTTVASNTASAAILIPLAIPLSGVLGVSTTGLVIVVAIASSIDFALVVGTPPTMIAYSTGLYNAGEIFRKGILLDLVGIVLLVVVITNIWQLIGII
jgi:sodium-dependent dicarboxylate transporter 2/3/5